MQLNKNQINLCDYRLIQACGKEHNQSSSLPQIDVGVDFSSEPKEVAYYDAKCGIVRTLECVTSWTSFQMETLQDAVQFADALKCLRFRFEEMQLGTIAGVVLVVPHSFNCFQREMICRIADSIGIRVLRTGTATVFHSLCIHSDEDLLYGIVCNFQKNDFEISMIVTEENVVEVLGTDGIHCNEGWSALSQADFEKRIRGEVKQLFRDVGMTPDEISQLWMGGQRNQMIEDLLCEITGLRPEKNTGSPATGALLQSMIVRGTIVVVLASTINRNIWIALGENGEKAISIDRYTSIPTRKKVPLLLSTQTQLRIYEGNFYNSAYDSLLASLPLDGLNVAEGKEIECEFDLDTNAVLSLTVYNHRHEKIIDRYRL